MRSEDSQVSDQLVKIKVKNSGHAWLRPIVPVVLVLFILLIAEPSLTCDKEMDTYPIWSKGELDFDGLESLGMGEPNPYQVSTEVAFTRPGDQVYLDLEFSDRDGSGGLAWVRRINMSFANHWN